MMDYINRARMIAIITLVVFAVSVSPGISAELNSEAILKRLDAMSQKIQEMGSEIKALKKENKDLREELGKVNKEQAEAKKAVASTEVNRPLMKPEPLISNKPFKGDVQVDAEYLYLTVNADAAPYAGKLSGYVSDSATVNAEKETEFDKNGAWRFGLAYVAPSDWDVGVKFMRFKTDGDSSMGERGVDNDNVYAYRLDRNLADDILNYDFDDGVADHAQQKMDLKINIWDLDVGHTFRTTNYTSMRLFGGFRYIDMDNDSKIKYEDWESGNYLVANIEDKLDMNGYGARIGGGFMWDIWDTGLSFDLDTALSLVYADFKVMRRDVYRSPAETGVRKVTSDFDSLLPIIDVNLGLKYQYSSFFVKGGYTFSYWFNGDLKHQVNGYDDVDGSTSPYEYEKADLSFHGWTIFAGVLF